MGEPETDDARAASGRGQRRRRRVPGGRQHRHEVKVTPEEEARLLILAADQRVSIPRLFVEAALAGDGATPAAREELVAELFAVHRLLATIANNVNQVARVANSTMQVPVETEATLAAVRRVAVRIDECVDAMTVGAS